MAEFSKMMQEDHGAKKKPTTKIKHQANVIINTQQATGIGGP
jgi:hypothetical protein